jgi:hypothetical protein
MAKTAVADIIIPTEFEKYAIERTAQLSVFVQSGIIEHAPEFDELAAWWRARRWKMPFWKDLTAARQILSDGAPLAVNKITSDQGHCPHPQRCAGVERESSREGHLRR